VADLNNLPDELLLLKRVFRLFFDFELDMDELEGDAREEFESNELLFLLLVDLREFLPFALIF
jgi:hypothetical protein